MTRVRSRALAAPVLLALGLLALVACSGESSAPPDPGPIRLLPSEAVATIGPETRLALILKPPALAERSFDLVLPESAVLRFGYGIPHASRVEGAAGAVFRVDLDDGETLHPIFQGRVDLRDPKQQRWFDVEADLSAFAPGAVSLRFAVAPDAGKPPLGVFSDPVVQAADAPDGRRNLIIVSLDTLRARMDAAGIVYRDITEDEVVAGLLI